MTHFITPEEISTACDKILALPKEELDALVEKVKADPFTKTLEEALGEGNSLLGNPDKPERITLPAVRFKKTERVFVGTNYAQAHSHACDHLGKQPSSEFVVGFTTSHLRFLTIHETYALVSEKEPTSLGDVLDVLTQLLPAGTTVCWINGVGFETQAVIASPEENDDSTGPIAVTQGGHELRLPIETIRGEIAIISTPA